MRLGWIALIFVACASNTTRSVAKPGGAATGCTNCTQICISLSANEGDQRSPTSVSYQCSATPWPTGEDRTTGYSCTAVVDGEQHCDDMVPEV